MRGSDYDRRHQRRGQAGQGLSTWVGSTDNTSVFRIDISVGFAKTKY